MKIPKDYFLVKVDKAYNDTVDVNGTELMLNITFDPYKFARQYGIVSSTPAGLPKGLKFDVKKGDKIYFHHLVTAAKSGMSIDATGKQFEQESNQDYKSLNLVTWVDEENIYRVHWQQIYARVRRGKLKMLHHWNFIKQKIEDEESIRTKSGIFIKPEVEDITLHGVVEHMNDWLKGQGVKIGDEIIFSEN